MRKVVRKFNTLAEGDRADRQFYRRLTPRERLDILLELIATQREDSGEAAAGFERVYRVVKLAGR